MAAALANLQCATCDTARRYAGFFLAATFPYHAIRAAFDAADGPRALMNLLRHMATLGPSQSTTSKSVACQVGSHTSQYSCTPEAYRFNLSMYQCVDFKSP